jgi:hypothetical protein
MLILFDNGTQRGLARFLSGHTVEEALARGWEELSNGELIEAAEQAGFELMVTTDKNIRYQQNLTARKIAVVVLEHSQWPMANGQAGCGKHRRSRQCRDTRQLR